MTTTSTFKPASLYQTDLIDPQTGLAPASIVAPGYLTPPQIANAYGIPASTGAGIKVGIISPGGGGFLQSDLNKSFVDLKAAGLISPSISTPIINQYLFDGQTGSFIGGGAASFENTLDIYCVATMVPEATINMYIGSDFTNPVLQAIADGCDIITISWAGTEYAYNWYETLWTQCAAAGITVVAASGDWGSVLTGQPSLSVCYPAASPQVIAIGGTKLTLTGSNTRLTETDDNRDPAFGPTWGGGGGISDLFSLPTWQQNLHYTPIIGGVIGSPTPLPRRGIPDVAAPMNVYGMYYGGGSFGVGGTSAAAPVWAGILARMQKLTGVKRNSQQYNTIFYANTSSFYDITVGTNNTEINDGYAGTVEWDPVTGLGPPIGASLLSILQPSFTMIVNTSTVTLRQFEFVTGTLIPVTNPLASSFSISPTLPLGLAFDDYTAEITGSPQSYLHATNFNVTAYDLSGHVATASFSLTVLPTVLVTTATTASVTLTKGIVIDTFAPVTASGGDGNYLYSVTPSMPSGIYYDDYTGEISGIPQSVSSTGTYTVSVADGFSQHSTSTFKLRVKPTPYTAVINSASVILTKGVVVDIFVPVAPSVEGNYLYSINPGVPSGLYYDDYTGEISGSPQSVSSTGTYTVTITDLYGQSASGQFKLRVKPPQLTAIVNTSSVTLTVGTLIEPFIPVVCGLGAGNYSYSITPSLPSGITYDSLTGEISGIPQSVSSTATYTVTIGDIYGQSVSGQFSLRVAYRPLIIQVSTSSVKVWQDVTVDPFIPVSATGGFGSLTYGITPSLPSGLSFDTLTGTVSGLPSTTFSATTFTVTVSDTIGQQAFGQFSLSSVALTAIVNTTSVNLIIAEPVIPFRPMQAVNGYGTTVYSITPGIPNNLTFNTQTGFISGTPAVFLSETSYAVSAVDSIGRTVTEHFALTISAPLLVVTPSGRRFVCYPNTYVDFTPVEATSWYGTLTYSIQPQLPQGLNFNTSTGQITGTPIPASYSRIYTITATDSANQTFTTNFTLKVKKPSAGRLIDSDIQNTVYNSLFDLMGTTATGYGAVLIGDPVIPGEIVKPREWNSLIQDIERCLIHQNGTSTNIYATIPVATTGSLVKFTTPATMYSTIQFLQQHIGQVDPSQLDSFTYNTSATSAEVWTCTNYTSTVAMVRGTGYITTVNWSWFYENQIRYFFNLGGQIQPQITLGKVRTKERASWEALINAANAQAVFNREKFLLALADTTSSTYSYILTGPGTSAPALNRLSQLAPAAAPHRIEVITSSTGSTEYNANALIVSYQVLGSTVIGTLNFIAALGNTKDKKSFREKYKEAYKWDTKGDVIGTRIVDVYDRTIIGTFINVQVELINDFKTTYPNGANGGIAAQIPQTQIIANRVSASPSPIPEFTTGVGDTTDPQIVTLRNNSTLTCIVDNIVLRGYTTGTVSPTSLTIAPNSSETFSLEYTGAYPGHHRGYVDVLCNVNPLTLFTEINVGSTHPQSLFVNTTTYDVVSQDFVVDHAGGYFKSFEVELTYGPGFGLVDHVGDTNDTFRVTFDPTGLPNGTHSTTARVTVSPLDSSQEPTVWEVPIEIDVNVLTEHLADWRSCKLGDDTTLGISYDVFSGVRYLTIGLCRGVPPILELRTTSYPGWDEVYRIPLNSIPEILHTKDYMVKSSEGFVYGEYFGVGNARGSLITVNHDGLGNVDILMSTVYETPSVNTVEVLDLATAFRYYDSRRAHQLQSQTSLVQDGQTYVFLGFDRSGDLMLSLTSPN